MQIHNAIITGSFSYNGADLSNVTSSNAYSASLSIRTTDLESTSSLLVGASSSFSSILTSVSSSQQQISASLLTLTASYNALSASYTALSASYNTASSSFSTRITSDSSSMSSRTTQVEKTYASTGSNTFTGLQNFSNTCTPNSFTAGASIYTAGGLQVTQDSYFSSSVFIKGNVTVFGTQSVSYISSSQLDIGTNIITVNTSTPSVRYGGLSVFDSGSTGLTGSIFWDSELNRWIYVNASGSGGGATYGGGMFISGPRNSVGLGCEQGTTACMLLVGQGGDHLTSSMIYHSSTVTCIPNAIVGGSTACFTGNTIVSTTGNTTLTINGTSGVPALSFTNTGGTNNIYGGVGSVANITIAPGDVNAVKIFAVGCVSCFAGTVCAPTLLTNTISLGGNAVCPTNAGLGYGMFGYSGIGLGIASSANGPNQGIGFFVCGDVERMRIITSGNVGIGTVCPSYLLDVNGTARVQGDALYVYDTGNIEIGRDTTYSTPYMAIGFGGRANANNKIYAARDATDGIIINAATGRGVQINTNGGATNALTIASTGIATFGNNVNTGNLVGNTVADGNAEYQFVTGASTNTRSGIAIKDSWNGTNNNNAYVKLFVGTGSGAINALSINYLGAATFSSSVTATSLGIGLTASAKIQTEVGNTTSVGLFSASGLAITSGGGSTGNIYQIAFGYGGGTYGSSALYGLTESSTGYNTGALVFATRALTTDTAPIERMRITSAGNVIVGNAAYAGTTTDLSITGDKVNSDGYYSRLIFQNSNQSGGSSASIRGERKTSNYNTELTFYTAETEGAGAERMRINAAGDLIIGRSTKNYTEAGSQFEANGKIFGVTTNIGSENIFVNRISSQTGNFLNFLYNNGSVGTVSTNGSTTSYNTSSDYRLKEDLKDYNGLDIVSQLKTYDFKWKEAGTRDYGMMAHELQEVLPNVVTGEKDALNEDSTIKPQGVDYSKLVPVLVKSIQEQQCTINTLKTCLGIA